MTNQVNQAFEKWFSTLKVEYRGNEPMVVLMTSWATNAFYTGYQAATQASESEINSLKQHVKELTASNNQLVGSLREAKLALLSRVLMYESVRSIDKAIATYNKFSEVKHD